MKQIEKKYFLALCLITFSYLLKAQHQFQIINNDNSPVFEKLNYQKTFAKAQNAKDEAKKIVTSLQASGYITASGDSFVSDSLQHKLYLSIGKEYKLAALKKGNAEDF